MQDTRLLAEVVEEVFRKVGRAPTRPPYTASQQRFVRLEVVPDPNAPGRMKLRETEETLPLPKPPS